VISAVEPDEPAFKSQQRDNALAACLAQGCPPGLCEIAQNHTRLSFITGWVLQGPRRRLLHCGWPSPGAAPIWRSSRPPPRLSRHVWRKAARLSSVSYPRKPAMRSTEARLDACGTKGKKCHSRRQRPNGSARRARDGTNARGLDC
jgi:hypothetical protein